MLITFSGLDGAGKSTLIDWLQAELVRRHRPVRVLHMTDNVGMYAAVRSVRDAVGRLTGRRPAPASDLPRMTGEVPRHAGDGALAKRLRTLAWRVRDAVLWNKPIRRVLYLLDLMIFQVIRWYVETVRGQVLITDRYFYDTLVDVADDGRWFWVRLLERVTPAPDVPVFLEISPEESFARKGEYSVPYLARRGAAYHAVQPLVPRALVVRNDDLTATQRVLARAVLEPACP
jgi:thymidylate kinase